jgi:heterodisulfide reductase subunit A-like polyferredoxin
MSSPKFQTEHYDLLVLGSGEAGKFIAWTMGSDGKKAAVIERRYIGGSCPNIACLPNKNIKDILMLRLPVNLRLSNRNRVVEEDQQ